MANEITSNNSDQSQADEQNPQAQAASSGSQAEQRSSKENLSELSQEDLAKLVKKLRNENAGNRKKLDDVELAQRQELERKMAEQGQYKELLSQKDAEIEQLKQTQEQYNVLSERVKEMVNAQIKGWPQEALTFHPGDEASAEDLLAWREKATPYVTRLAQQQQASQPGNSPNPRPADGQASQRQRVDTLKVSNRSRYSGF